MLVIFPLHPWWWRFIYRHDKKPCPYQKHMHCNDIDKHLHNMVKCWIKPWGQCGDKFHAAYVCKTLYLHCTKFDRFYLHRLQMNWIFEHSLHINRNRSTWQLHWKWKNLFFKKKIVSRFAVQIGDISHAIALISVTVNTQLSCWE